MSASLGIKVASVLVHVVLTTLVLVWLADDKMAPAVPVLLAPRN